MTSPLAHEEEPISDLDFVRVRSDALGRALADLCNGHGVEGGGWTHHTPKRSHVLSATVLHPAGLGLGLRHTNTHLKGAAGRRLTVEGAYPSRHSRPRAEPITVGMNQPPSRIFREIRLRLLPDYLATIGAALDAAAEAERDEQARIAMNHRLKQVLPNLGDDRLGRQEPPGRARSHWSGGKDSLAARPAIASGEVKLNHDATSMDLQISGVPAELALRILALLNPCTATEEGTAVPQESLLPPVTSPALRTILVQGAVVPCPGEPPRP
jgi:hypothetical protein